MDFVFIQETFPCRHLIMAAIGNGFNNGFLSTTPQPYVVSQIRAGTTNTLTFVAMAGKAVCRWAVKQFFTAFCTNCIILFRRFGQRHDIVCNVFNALFTQSRTP